MRMSCLTFSGTQKESFAFPEIPDAKRCLREILEPEECVPATYDLSDHKWEKVQATP